MSGRIKIVASVSIAVVILAALLVSPALAQGPASGRSGAVGQWGGPGRMPALSPDEAMNGWGHGPNCPGGPGGPGGPGYPGTPITTIDQAIQAAQQYVAAYGDPDLELAEVMEFTNNFYAQVRERSSGIGAFELLINRYTGAVYPEPGPNMMWNTRYGHMGGWWGRPSGPMTVTPDQARQYAQQYLDTYWPGATVSDEADTFYGYYTAHILQNGQITGMLSVNGYTGQVWYHTWHGQYIGMWHHDG